MDLGFTTGAIRLLQAALPPSILDLPLEVLVHILELGAFTPTELAPIRAVCVALRSAASHPTLYRVWAIDVAGPHFGRSAPKVVGMDQRLKAVPEWVATSLWGLELSGNPSPVVCVPGDVFPSLDRLEVRAAWDVPRYEALPPTLTRLFLSDARCLAPDMLAALTRVECLFLGCVDDIDTLPIASLPRLRRLSLKDCFGDLRTLLGALADSPAAASLEAFDFALSSGDNAPYTAGWWEPLAVLPALRELGLATKPAMFEGGDAEAFASVIAGLDQVQSLTLSLMSNDVVLAVAPRPPASLALGRPCDGHRRWQRGQGDGGRATRHASGAQLAVLHHRLLYGGESGSRRVCIFTAALPRPGRAFHALGTCRGRPGDRCGRAGGPAGGPLSPLGPRRSGSPRSLRRRCGG